MHSVYVSQLLAVTLGLRSASLNITASSRPTAHATSHSGAVATPCTAAKRRAASRAVSFANHLTASGPGAAPIGGTRFTTISRNGAVAFGNTCGGVCVAAGLGRQRSGPRPPKKSATWAQRPSKERCGAAASAAARRAARSSGARGASRSHLITSPSASTRTTSTGSAYGSQGSSSYT